MDKISLRVNHHLLILERKVWLLTLLLHKNYLRHLFLYSLKFNKTKYSSIFNNRVRFRPLSFYLNLIICKERIRNMSILLIILRFSKWCRTNWIINSCHLITCLHLCLRQIICIRWAPPPNRSLAFPTSSSCNRRWVRIRLCSLTITRPCSCHHPLKACPMIHLTGLHCQNNQRWWECAVKVRSCRINKRNHSMIAFQHSEVTVWVK